MSLFILGAILLFQSNSDKQSNELSLLEPKHTNREIHNVSSGDFFQYNVGSDIYRFDIPEGYGDATLLYEEILKDSRLKFSLVSCFMPKEHVRERLNGNLPSECEFLKIDILKRSLDSKVSPEKFKEAIDSISNSLPKITSRDHKFVQKGFMIANDQIKKVRGDDASIEVVSLTNLGAFHKDDLSLLWTQVMPFDFKFNGKIKRYSVVGVLGIFYLDGRGFYFTQAKEFKQGFNLKNLESNALSYLKQIMKQN